MKNKTNQEPSRNKWYIVTALCCLCVFPAYIFVIVFSITEFKKNLQKNTAILYSGLGAFVFSMTYIVIFLITGVLKDWDMTSLFTLPQMILAIYLICVYALHARYANRMSMCLSLIQNDHITSLDELSGILGVNADKVKKYIKRLIKTKHLDGAMIDETKNEIVFTKSIWARQRFVCRYCGAESIVNFGHTLVCDYCGQALPLTRQ